MGSEMCIRDRFVLVNLVTINLIAFMLAYVLSRKLRGTNIFRTVIFMPNLLGGIVLGYIWQLIINGFLSFFKTTLTADAAYGFWGMVLAMNWQMIGYMMVIYIAAIQNISEEVKEAALIDGCTRWQTYWKIVFPLLKPTIATVAIIDAMAFWNDYLLPSLVLNINQYKTIPIAIQYLKQSHGMIDWGAMMAMLVLAILPIVIFYIVCQKYIIEGVLAGAVKG